MPKKKHVYQIEINDLCDTVDTYSYDYGNIKNITIDISDNGVRVSFEIGREYSVDEILGYGKYYFFPDAVKKALLIHVIKYSKEVCISSIKIMIDGSANDIDPADQPLVYGLIEGELIRPVSNLDWTMPAVINGILSFTKTTQDGRMASLYSLLCSKTKKYEVERFIYLWMAFNGLYGYISRITENLVPLVRGKKQKIGDGEGIGLLLALYNWANERVVENQSKAVARRVIGDLETWDGSPISFDSLDSGVHQGIKTLIQSRLVKSDGSAIDITEYGYLLGYFSYYFRCNIIHANKPIPLYSYESEYEIRCLKVINQLLEDFLENNLSKYFDETYHGTLITDINRVIHAPAFQIKRFTL